MEKIKKLWKEISVFGVVIIVFIGLFAYNKIMFTDFTTVSQEKVQSMIDAKDSFVLVVGNSTDSATASYKEVMKTFVDKNRSDKLYYVNFETNDEALAYMIENFQSEESTVPQTYVIKDGEVLAHKSGAITYSRLQDLYTLK